MFVLSLRSVTNSHLIALLYRGFIRVRGEVVSDKVRIYVEDSGPGIPLEKRGKLFDKYQESLDLLNQGYVANLSYYIPAHCLSVYRSHTSFSSFVASSTEPV
jgi:hypothetical protein